MSKVTSKKNALPRTYTLTLRKTSERALNPAKINQQLQKIKNRALGGNRQARGWQCRVNDKEQAPTSPGLPYAYTAIFSFSCNPRRAREPESIAREWDHIVHVATTAGNQPLWLPEQVEGKQIKQEDQRVARPDTLELAEYDIPDHWKDWFKEVYGRDEQIETIIDVLKEAKESNYTNRFNVILEGPPGSGKTEILRCLKKHLPPDCWLEFDCTNTTAAGAIEELRSRAKMPTVIFLEEAEKATRQKISPGSWQPRTVAARSEKCATATAFTGRSTLFAFAP